MEYYEKYVSCLQTEGTGPAVLQKMYQEAVDSLETDPPELALTCTGQMAAAMLKVAKSQEPPERQLVDAINGITDMMIDYLGRMGWRSRAYKTSAGWIYESSPA